MKAILVGPNNHSSCLEDLTAAYRLEMVAHFPAPGAALTYVRIEPQAPEAMVIDISALHDPTMDHALVQLLDTTAPRWPDCRVAVVLGEAQQYLLDQLQHANTRVFRPGQADGDPATPLDTLGGHLVASLAAYLELPRRQEVRARTILVLSAKGGVGKTTLIANLATALVVRHGLRVAVVDGDLTRGDLAHLLGVEPSVTLLDLLADRSPGGIRGALDRYLAYLHDGRLALLPAPGGSLGSDRPWTSLTTRHAQAVLTALGDRFDVVLLDTPPDVQRSSPFPAAVIGMVNGHPSPFLALVVVQPQPMERQGARQVLDFLAAHSTPHGQVRGVLINRNRATGNPGYLERALGVEIMATVPYDPRAATAREATDLVHDFDRRRLNPAARAYVRLAEQIVEEGE